MLSPKKKVYVDPNPSIKIITDWLQISPRKKNKLELIKNKLAGLINQFGNIHINTKLNNKKRIQSKQSKKKE